MESTDNLAEQSAGSDNATATPSTVTALELVKSYVPELSIEAFKEKYPLATISGESDKQGYALAEARWQDLKKIKKTFKEEAGKIWDENLQQYDDALKSFKDFVKDTTEKIDEVEKTQYAEKQRIDQIRADRIAQERIDKFAKYNGKLTIAQAKAFKTIAEFEKALSRQVAKFQKQQEVAENPVISTPKSGAPVVIPMPSNEFTKPPTGFVTGYDPYKHDEIGTTGIFNSILPMSDKEQLIFVRQCIDNQKTIGCNTEAGKQIQAEINIMIGKMVAHIDKRLKEAFPDGV